MWALITGASSGIGCEMAKIMSEMGYNLVLVARRQDKLKQLKEELNTDVRICTYDLSVKENCYHLFDEVQDLPITVLINNAGFGDFGPFHLMDDNKLENMMNVNVNSLTILCHLFLKKFISQKEGRILNVASAAAFTFGPLMSEYYASKAYVYHFSVSLNEEIKRLKLPISVAVLCPGPVKTEFNDVANVNFAIKGLTSQKVARYAIKKMFKGKTIIVPGRLMKISKFLTRFVSDKSLAKIGYHIQKKKE